jgi:hypothetical protein
MKNWKFLFMSMTIVGVLFLAACGNADEDTSNTGNMNEEEMSDEMEKDENGDMSNEEMGDEMKENDEVESEENMKEESEMEGKVMMEKDEKMEDEKMMEDGMESKETMDGM